MAHMPGEDPAKDNPAKDPAADPQKDPSKDKKDDAKPDDAAALNKRLGELEKENQSLKEYQAKVDPVMQTIFGDQELYKKVEETHTKRLNPDKGKKDDKDKKDDPPTDGKDKKDTEPSKGDSDSRTFLVKGIVEKFNTKYKIDKLTADERKDLNVKIGTMLQDMLDPKGNKTLAQILEDVPLTKLPGYLDHAYFMINKDKLFADAKEQGKSEALSGELGITGGFSSSDITPDSVTLSAKEKKIAENLGISEDRYLARKKEILKRDGKLV